MQAVRLEVNLVEVCQHNEPTATQKEIYQRKRVTQKQGNLWKILKKTFLTTGKSAGKTWPPQWMWTKEMASRELEATSSDLCLLCAVTVAVDGNIGESVKLNHLLALSSDGGKMMNICYLFLVSKYKKMKMGIWGAVYHLSSGLCASSQQLW